MKAIKIFIFYFLFIIYSLEILIFFFSTENTLSKKEIINKRIEIAKSKGLDYDTRTRDEAFLDLKKINKDLKPAFYYSPIFKFSKTFKDAKKK